MFGCMKKTRLPLLAIMAACIALAVAHPAYAEESTRADDLWSPTIVVNTDKAEYASGERIVVTATTENDVAEHAQKTAFGDEGARTEGLDELAGDFDVVIAVPDGYAVVEGSAKASAVGVLPGEKVAARAVIAKQAGAPAAGTSTKAASSSTKTGDAPWILVFAVLVAASAAILAIATIKRRGAGASSRMLSCLLALVLVAGLSPWAPGSAHAADEDASHPEHVGRGSATFTVGGESVTVTAAVVAEHAESTSGFDEIPDSYGQTSPVAAEDRTPRVEAAMVDAQVQAVGEGTYDVVTTMKVRIHQGEGTVDLEAGTVELENAYSASTEERDRAYPGTIAVAGADTITATQRFTVGGDTDLVWDDANPESELIWQAVIELKSHAVILSGDAVKDADGNTVEVPAMRPYVDRGQSAHAASAQSISAQAASEPANLTAQADSSDETAAKSLEAADKALEAIGEFVSAVVKDDAGEAIQGAGSILGVVAKGITLIDGASGVTYDLVDVVERLDSISSDIKGLTSQVGQVSSQLDSIKQQTEFTMTGNEVADLVATGLRYKDYVTGAMNALDRAGVTGQSANAAQALAVVVAVPPASGDAGGNALVAGQLVAQGGSDRASQIRANYENLSDEDKGTLQSLANQTKHTVSYYGASAYETAIKLADKVTATTWGMDNIYKAYSKYVGSYLNWEPETYSLVKAYTAELNLGFTYAYLAAMNELGIEIATTSDQDIKDADLLMLDQLLGAAGKVCSVNNSDDVKALMESRSDGKVRNLVTGTLFEPYSGDWSHGFVDRSFTARRDMAPASQISGWIPRDFDLDNAGKFPVQRRESAISRDQFETMFSRLGTVRTIGGYEGATSLKAEMELVGLLPSGYAPDGFGDYACWDEYAEVAHGGGWDWRLYVNDVKTGGDKSLPLKIRQQAQSCYYFYTESNDNPQKVKDKESVEHVRDITGTAVNIAATSQNDLVKENVVLYRLDEKYVACHGWRLYVTYHPLALASSAGS